MQQKLKNKPPSIIPAANPVLRKGAGDMLESIIQKLQEKKKQSFETPEKWIENRLIIKNKKAQLIPFKLNKIQQKIADARNKALKEGRKLRFIILKARREGVTTLQQAYNFHLVATKDNQQVVTLAHDSESVEKIFRISTLFYDMLPAKEKPERLTKHNKRDLNFPAKRSLFYVGTPGKEGFGRGDTLNRVHWSEVAWSPGDKEDQRRLLSGLTEACSEGEVVLESTPNGIGDLFHEKWQEAESGASEWIPLFFTWWDDETNRIKLSKREVADLEDTYTEEEYALCKKHGLDAEQIAWRRAAQQEHKSLFAQEYPEDPATCFLTSGSAFFDKMLIARMIFRLKEPLEVRGELSKENGLGGGTQIFWPPVPGGRYVLACDVAEGVPNGAYSVGSVLDIATMKQMAVLRGRWSPAEFAQRCVELANEYNGALIAVERNNHGHSMLTTLLHVLNYENLYYHMDYDAAMGKHHLELGFPTNKKTRPILLDELREAIEKGYMEVFDKFLLQECLTFMKDEKADKYEAAPGYRDDTIFSWGIGVQVRKDIHNKPVDLGSSESVLPQTIVQPLFQGSPTRLFS